MGGLPNHRQGKQSEKLNKASGLIKDRDKRRRETGEGQEKGQRAVSHFINGDEVHHPDFTVMGMAACEACQPTGGERNGGRVPSSRTNIPLWATSLCISSSTPADFLGPQSRKGY